MGKVIVLISTTPDGFAESQNVIIDPEFFEFVHSLIGVSEAVVFGRTTFEQFQDRWQERLLDLEGPEWLRKMAESLNAIKKVVFSSTLTSATWNNTEIINTLNMEYIQTFKKNSQGSMLTFGSLSVVEALIEMNAVDEYYFNIQPCIPGNGKARFFAKKNLHTVRQLKFVDCTPLASGAHIIHYEKKNESV